MGSLYLGRLLRFIPLAGKGHFHCCLQIVKTFVAGGHLCAASECAPLVWLDKPGQTAQTMPCHTHFSLSRGRLAVAQRPWGMRERGVRGGGDGKESVNVPSRETCLYYVVYS